MKYFLKIVCIINVNQTKVQIETIWNYSFLHVIFYILFGLESSIFFFDWLLQLCDCMVHTIVNYADHFFQLCTRKWWRQCVSTKKVIYKKICNHTDSWQSSNHYLMRLHFWPPTRFTPEFISAPLTLVKIFYKHTSKQIKTHLQIPNVKIQNRNT